MSSILAQFWQKIDAGCLYCHSWQVLDGGRITAMTATILFLVIASLVVLAFGLYTAKVVQGDGYGSRRQPPASHNTDIFDPRTGRLA
jgi:hypothetical protein